MTRPTSRARRAQKPKQPGRVKGAGRASRAAWTVGAMRQRCRSIREALTVRKLASQQEIDNYWPGGKENQEESPLGAWIYCYGVYNGYLRRENDRQQHNESPEAVARADAEVLDALRDAPVAVRLVGAPLEAEAPAVWVYPKSLDALLHLHALDVKLAWMTDQHRLVMRAIEQGRTDLLDTVPVMLTSISYTYQLCAWIVTTPGPAMPYAADDEDPQPPTEITALAPWDVIRICEAHQRHLMRAHAVARLVSERRQGEGGQRPSWSMFIGSMAVDAGESAVTLMKHRSLASLLAAARLNAAAKSPPADAPRAAVV